MDHHNSFQFACSIFRLPESFLDLFERASVQGYQREIQVEITRQCHGWTIDARLSLNHGPGLPHQSGHPYSYYRDIENAHLQYGELLMLDQDD